MKFKRHMHYFLFETNLCWAYFTWQTQWVNLSLQFRACTRSEVLVCTTNRLNAFLILFWSFLSVTSSFEWCARELSLTVGQESPITSASPAKSSGWTEKRKKAEGGTRWKTRMSQHCCKVSTPTNGAVLGQGTLRTNPAKRGTYTFKINYCWGHGTAQSPSTALQALSHTNTHHWLETSFSHFPMADHQIQHCQIPTAPHTTLNLTQHYSVFIKGCIIVWLYSRLWSNDRKWKNFY